MALRTPTDSTPTKAQLLAALLRKVSALRLMDQGLLSEQIELERAGHEPTTRQPESEHVQRSRALLNGHHGLLPDQTAGAEGARLSDVLTERKAVALALDVLQREESRAATLALGEWLADGGEQRWHANRRKLADALLTVKAAVAEAAAIRNEAALATKAPLQLPGDMGDRPLLDIHAQRVLEAIQAAGIIT